MVCYDRMKTLYDVQEFLKLHGYINLFSKRLDAIFFMAQELKTLYDAGLIPNERDYFTADRAKPHFWRMPPDSSRGYAPSKPSRPTLSSSATAFTLRSASGTARAFSATSTFC